MSGVVRAIVVQTQRVANSVAPAACRCFWGTCRESGAVGRGGVRGVEWLDLRAIWRVFDGEAEGATQPGVALHYFGLPEAD